MTFVKLIEIINPEFDRQPVIINLDWVMYARPMDNTTVVTLRGDPDPIVLDMEFDSFVTRVFKTNHPNEGVENAIDDLGKIIASTRR